MLCSNLSALLLLAIVRVVYSTVIHGCVWLGSIIVGACGVELSVAMGWLVVLALLIWWVKPVC